MNVCVFMYVCFMYVHMFVFHVFHHITLNPHTSYPYSECACNVACSALTNRTCTLADVHVLSKHI